MKKCPRCHSSMLLDFTASPEGYERLWKCLGCGREILHDPVRQAEDERQRRQICSGELKLA